MKHPVLLFFLLLLTASSALAGDRPAGKDLENLRAAIKVTRTAVEAGQPPFGAVIAGPDGTILMVQENLSFKLHDPTRHAESVLASRFAQVYQDPAFRAKSTLYSSMEPCAMCMFTIFNAGIGRVVYGLSADRLYDLFNRFGTWPRIHLSSRQAAGFMSSPTTISGPFLEDEAAALVEQSLVRLKERLDENKGEKKQ